MTRASRPPVTRVLVVDDSPTSRAAIASMLSAIPGVEVVGEAGSGDAALRLVVSREPDLVTLDLEMPRVDGFTFLRLMMARRPTPVIIVSGNTVRENVFRALELGAIDFVAKPSGDGPEELEELRRDLVEKVGLVRHLSNASLDRARKIAAAGGGSATGTYGVLNRADLAKKVTTLSPRRLLVVGASTGGPAALIELYMRFPADAPVASVIAQHMPRRFTKTFAERLDRMSPASVAEGSGVEKLTIGRTILCPGGESMEIEAGSAPSELVARVVSPAEGDRYTPSVDRLFTSAAAAAGSRTVAVVLTGMGDDGARGVLAVKEAGGTVLVESEESAVVSGMPLAALNTGAVDRVLPLKQLADHLRTLLMS